MTEEWRDVPGYDGYYQISSHGNIRSIRKEMKPVDNSRGYLRVGLVKNKTYKWRSIHSLVIEAFIGPRPDGMQVEHIDHNKKNNFVGNLRYCTPKENTARNFVDGNSLVGEDHPNHKLTSDQVRQIKANEGKIGQKAMARKYGVSRRAISMILKGRTWKRV